ncbi:hypothetical protein KIPB_012502, partial [Kipferlia bialata]|eukprot:g12502.t1
MPSTRFVWRVEQFEDIPDRLYSSPFLVGQQQWRLILVNRQGLYLDPVLLHSEVSMSQWQRKAAFEFHVVDQRAPIHEGSDLVFMDPATVLSPGTSLNTQHPFRAEHTFTGKVRDRGFNSVIPSISKDAYRAGQSSDGVLSRGGVIVVVDVVCLSEPNDKEEEEEPPSMTAVRVHDCVGFQNQGATCYMNSLLQIFYLVPGIRSLLYRAALSESAP